MFNTIAKIAQFEIIQAIKKPGFWVFPIIIVVTILVSGILPSVIINSVEGGESSIEVSVIDTQKILNISEKPESEGIEYKIEEGKKESVLEEIKNEDKAALLFVENADTFELYQAQNSDISRSLIQRDVAERVLEYKIEEGIISGSVDDLQDPEVSRIYVPTEADTQDIQRGIGFGIGLGLFVLIMVIGSRFMNQIIIEKNSKVYEIILTSISTKELFLGKYLGFVGKSIIQIFIFAVAFIASGAIATSILVNMFEPETVSTVNVSSSQVETIEVSELEPLLEIFELFNPLNTSIIFIYGLLGLVLYSVLLGMIGASYTNYMEASNSSLSWVLTLPITGAMIGNMFFIAEPTHPASIFFQIFPLTSPIAVTSYIFGDIGWWQLGLSFVLLLFGIYVAFKVAAKVYLEGVLSQSNISLKGMWNIIRN